MRGLLWTATLVAVAGLAYFGRAWADDKKPAKPAPRTRIALFNLTFVIKNYYKYKEFQKEIKEISAPFQEKDTQLRKQFDELREKAEEATKAGGSEELKELERQAKDIKKKIEDNSSEAKLKLAKRSDAEMKTLYQDVYDVAREHALARGFDLVLHFNDALTKEDFESTKNVARKLNTGGLMPVYAADGMDISEEMVAILNRK